MSKLFSFRPRLSAQRKRLRNSLAELSVKSHQAYHKAKGMSATRLGSKKKTMKKLKRIVRESEKLNLKYVNSTSVKTVDVQKIHSDLQKIISNA